MEKCPVAGTLTGHAKLLFAQLPLLEIHHHRIAVLRPVLAASFFAGRTSLLAVQQQQQPELFSGKASKNSPRTSLEQGNHTCWRQPALGRE